MRVDGTAMLRTLTLMRLSIVRRRLLLLLLLVVFAAEQPAEETLLLLGLLVLLRLLLPRLRGGSGWDSWSTGWQGLHPVHRLPWRGHRRLLPQAKQLLEHIALVAGSLVTGFSRRGSIEEHGVVVRRAARVGEQVRHFIQPYYREPPGHGKLS